MLSVLNTWVFKHFKVSLSTTGDNALDVVCSTLYPSTDLFLPVDILNKQSPTGLRQHRHYIISLCRTLKVHVRCSKPTVGLWGIWQQSHYGQCRISQLINQ